jgi:hypothetical protein
MDFGEVSFPLRVHRVQIEMQSLTGPFSGKDLYLLCAQGADVCESSSRAISVPQAGSAIGALHY